MLRKAFKGKFRATKSSKRCGNESADVRLARKMARSGVSTSAIVQLTGGRLSQKEIEQFEKGKPTTRFGSEV